MKSLDFKLSLIFICYTKQLNLNESFANKEIARRNPSSKNKDPAEGVDGVGENPANGCIHSQLGTGRLGTGCGGYLSNNERNFLSLI